MPLGLRHRFRSCHVVGHGALDVAHDVEGRTVHRCVGAQAQRWRHGHLGTLKGGDDPVFAPHVMGAFENVAEWRPAQNIGGARLVNEAVSEIRMAASDQRKLQGWLQAINAFGQPSRDCFLVDAFQLQPSNLWSLRRPRKTESSGASRLFSSSRQALADPLRCVAAQGAVRILQDAAGATAAASRAGRAGPRS